MEAMLNIQDFYGLTSDLLRKQFCQYVASGVGGILPTPPEIETRVLVKVGNTCYELDTGTLTPFGVVFQTKNELEKNYDELEHEFAEKGL